MITGPNNKTVIIYITTYKQLHKKDRNSKMSEKKHGFICSFCLNTNHCGAECRNPTCVVNRQGCATNRLTDNAFIYTEDNAKSRKDRPRVNSKMVQTYKTDMNNDLNLLKEVLNAFQSKKKADRRTDSNTSTKHVAVGTEEIKTAKVKLARSKIIQYSIDENESNAGSRFRVIDRHPDRSQFSIGLTKQKSSSIPRMKMEELKHSLKEKTRSKDAIEEVNRMFATVRKTEIKLLEDANRPVTRNGPRVLPVVKTYYDASRKDTSDSDGDRRSAAICKCCQTNNIHLSAGDSFHKHECCYRKMLSEGKCEKCVYMRCCHYEKQKMDRGVSCCECCKKNGTEERFCER